MNIDDIVEYLDLRLATDLTEAETIAHEVEQMLRQAPWHITEDGEIILKEEQHE